MYRIPLSMVDLLVAKAVAHASWLETNRATGHEENQGRLGLSAVDVTGRPKSACPGKIGGVRDRP